jgi:transposase InsO family protein/transposase-like protein
MRVIFKYKWVKGFKTLYDYGIKHNHMITTEAKQRLKILRFWNKYGLKATKDAFNVSRSTLFEWKKIYRESGGELHSLNPQSQARINQNKRIINPDLLKEIKRLRLEVTPNMGKDKIKIFLDIYCNKNNIKTISASSIGRIIKEKKIYHQRQKVTHFGKIKTIKRNNNKLRKPKEFKANEVGDLIEIDTIVRFDWGIKRYIITAVDVSTRFTFAYIYKSHGSDSTKDFFKKLEQVYPYKIKRVQTDNGSEFHKHFKEYLKKKNIIHYWNYKGQPTKNGHIEKYNRTIQEEFIDQHSVLLENTQKFNIKLIDWLIWYNTKRPHWSLNLLSPVQYLMKNNYLSEMRWTDTISRLKKYFVV